MGYGALRTMTNYFRSCNRCEVCGRFVRDDDPYGDFHMSHFHPNEYAEQMRRWREHQAVTTLHADYKGK